MFARNRRLVITKGAANDVRTIRRYTRKQWGATQATTYEEAINDALESLRAFPEIRKTRDAFCLI
jgi:plasmid stabilization system protein ParE